MEEEDASSSLTLEYRTQKSEYTVRLFASLEPARCVKALTDARTRLVEAIQEADNEQLPPLVNTLIRVLEFGGRFYGLPSAPKGTAAKPGDNARPVLPMES